MVPQSLPLQRQQYDSDLSDEQWGLVRGFVPKVRSDAQKGGRPPKYERREILNAILYVARTGCQWRLLPHDFPKWKTAYDYFVLWHDLGVFELKKLLGGCFSCIVAQLQAKSLNIYYAD